MSSRRQHLGPRPQRIELAGQTIEAMSVGGVETSFQVPSFDCNLDIGRCPAGAIGRRHLLLSHAHMDHAAGLPYFVSMRSMQRLPPPRVYCPRDAVADLRQVLEAWARLDSDADRCELVGVGPGDRIELGGSRFATVFAAHHRVSGVGYALHQTRRKLKPELHGLDGPSIGARVRAGEVVYDEKVVTDVCFCGDTTAAVLDAQPEVGQARLLLLECTFLGDRPAKTWAERSGHVHLDDLAERSHLLQNEAIVLTHLSRRYSRSEVQDAVRRALPAQLRERLWVLLEGELISAAG